MHTEAYIKAVRTKVSEICFFVYLFAFCLWKGTPATYY